MMRTFLSSFENLNKTNVYVRHFVNGALFKFCPVKMLNFCTVATYDKKHYIKYNYTNE